MTVIELNSPGMDEPTAVAPTRHAPQPEQAWSTEDWGDDDYESAAPTVSWTRTSLTASAIVGVAAVAAVVLIAIFGWTAILGGNKNDTTPQASAPAPVTVTVTATPTAVAPPPPYTAAEDQEFLHQLQQLGYTINNPDRATTQAHNICNQYRAGKTSQQIHDLETQGVMQNQDPQAENQFQTTASLVYPQCG